MGMHSSYQRNTFNISNYLIVHCDSNNSDKTVQVSAVPASFAASKYIFDILGNNAWGCGQAMQLGISMTTVLADISLRGC